MPAHKMANNEIKEEQLDDSLIEALDFTNPDFTFTPKEAHEWRQKGFFIECRSCDLVHGTYIGPNKILIGIDEKGPLFKNR